jgi:hypothetical protein
MKRENGSYNKTKKRALEILENKTWLDVPTIAHKVGIRPVRRAYTYLAHLEDMGLVTRGWDAAGKLHFQITARGLERLEWLRAQKRSTLEEFLTPILRG